MFSAEREMQSPPSCCACSRFPPEERGVAVPGTPCGSALIRFLVQFTPRFSYSCCSAHFSQLLISRCLFSLSAGPRSIFAFPSLLFVLISMCLTYVFVAGCPIIATTFPCCRSPSWSSDGGSGSSQRWAGNRSVPAIHRWLGRTSWTSPYHEHEYGPWLSVGPVQGRMLGDASRRCGFAAGQSGDADSKATASGFCF